MQYDGLVNFIKLLQNGYCVEKSVIGPSIILSV